MAYPLEVLTSWIKVKASLETAFMAQTNELRLRSADCCFFPLHLVSFHDCLFLQDGGSWVLTKVQVSTWL
jgi:hypothetical protein